MPALLVSLLSALLFGLESSLSPTALLEALTLALLLSLGFTSFTVLGSAWDEDLSIAIEDRLQSLMQEELPITPRRLQLLGLTVLLFVSLLFLAWKLPFLLAFPALALVDGGILLLLWHVSLGYLARQLGPWR